MFKQKLGNPISAIKPLLLSAICCWNDTNWYKRLTFFIILNMYKSFKLGVLSKID